MKPNPQIAEALRRAKAELAQCRAEKLKLFPPNPHPWAEPDRFPHTATPELIARRNALVARIEELEHQIATLEDELYRPAA